jgi:hypothetical protein
MKLYGAYGLVLACERDLPLATARSSTAPDVTIEIALGAARHSPRPLPQRELLRDGADWSLRFRDSRGDWLDYDFLAAAATLRIAGSAEWEDAVPPLLGVVCAVLLSSMGRPLLHGAAVAWEDGAVAVLGDSGRGKSTLAAALLKEGSRLLSEDLLAFDRKGGVFAVEPGYARISLLPDASKALGLAAAHGIAPRRGTAKHWIEAPASTRAVELRRLYLLEPPDPAAPEGRAIPASRLAAGPALVRQLYGAPWIRPVSAADLSFCVALAAAVPVFTLSRPASLDAVHAFAAMVRAM